MVITYEVIVSNGWDANIERHVARKDLPPNDGRWYSSWDDAKAYLTGALVRILDHQLYRNRDGQEDEADAIESACPSGAAINDQTEAEMRETITALLADVRDAADFHEFVKLRERHEAWLWPHTYVWQQA